MNWYLLGYVTAGLGTAEIVWRVRRADTLAQVAVVILWPAYWYGVLRAIVRGD